MLTTIHIAVRDRVPTITAGEDVISHNSDYAAEFVFDEEWQDKVKTVYFVCEDGSYQAVVMSGNSCNVPMMAGEHRRIFVGVQAGSAEKPNVLKTTRPCCLKVKDSIADYLGQPIPDPTPDVYEQIIAMLNNLTAPAWETVQNKPFESLGDGLSVENGVLSVPEGGGGSANAVQYVAQTLTDEQKAQARENIGAGTSSFSGSYNDLTSKPTIPTQVTIDSTLMQSGQAADSKAVGDALGTKLDKNQGTENAGKILGIGEDGNVTPQDKPTYTLTDADKTAVAEEVVADGIAATLTDIPSGGGGTWTKIHEETLAEAVSSYVYPLDNVKAAAIVIFPGVAIANVWRRITIGSKNIPVFNNATEAIDAVYAIADVNEIIKFAGGKCRNVNLAINGANGAYYYPSTTLDGLTEINQIGTTTAELLVAGAKIEIYIKG